MSFVEPSWITGAIYYASWFFIPLILAVILGVIGAVRNSQDNTKGTVCMGLSIILVFVALIGGTVGSSIGWHYQYEVPSVQTKIVTVEDWQPTFGHYWGDVESADDLMLKTTDGELFGNNENFLFQKFNTRDILDKLKPNGTYEIKYYGWREGYNNGVPNILSVEKVINESNCPAHHDISNYMNKRSIIYAEDDRW